MSKLQSLIEELCPEGVKFLQVSELFDTRNGYTPSKRNESYWTNGTVPWFRMEDIRANGNVLGDSLLNVSESALKKNGKFSENSIIVATSATIGEHALITVPFLCNQRFTVLTPKQKYKDLINIKFLYYYTYLLDSWCLNNTTQSSFSSVDMKGFKKFKYALPPLEVQNEIVRILDYFTLLEAELEAELEARRKQYAHYREKLINFDDLSSLSLSLETE